MRATRYVCEGAVDPLTINATACPNPPAPKIKVVPWRGDVADHHLLPHTLQGAARTTYQGGEQLEQHAVWGGQNERAWFVRTRSVFSISISFLRKKITKRISILARPKFPKSFLVASRRVRGHHSATPQPAFLRASSIWREREGNIFLAGKRVGKGKRRQSFTEREGRRQREWHCP